MQSEQWFEGQRDARGRLVPLLERRRGTRLEMKRLRRDLAAMTPDDAEVGDIARALAQLCSAHHDDDVVVWELTRRFGLQHMDDDIP